ncbi:bile acid:sodium symporter family protein [Noviherbaspirillum suwonense]|jgi:sodium/bile acid cotransporter 7|uniref:Solute carrier family 10 (Sodium/bile acid cotransporter), member 7 n=1 Tax=Noviherbaspirillum suwonense TaxID=1224511 RepID=A0ABY1QGB5_9BURK|nr:bile acid:sodium symporter family protein [Noviherbaspirillum suwonense]SMP69940.1 solute carrier family 10 (sodium/bile acid cotransporter), member 7 [Noviherbaspirillum suwonense]
MTRPTYLPDNFTFAILLTVILASVLPCSGQFAEVAHGVASVAIGLLFFLHGAKLPREAIVAGATHWRLHVLVLCSTFLLFPLLGWMIKPLALKLVTPELYTGLLFLCVLPSTVQSSIALVAVARGNVPAAICSASASNLIGIFLTPLLVGLLVVHGASAGASLESVVPIIMQLLLPFTLGQLLRPRIGAWVDKRKATLRLVDQGSILLVVYTAFSAAVIEGLWDRLPMTALAGLVVVNLLLLGLALSISTLVSRRMGFNREDEITLVFCASKKSLASGLPMAKVLFASQSVGMIVLPLMLFHQIQLMVCAVLAQRYARRADVLLPETAHR